MKVRYLFGLMLLSSQLAAEPTIFSNVNIVHPQTAQVSKGQDVLVDNGRILSIRKHQNEYTDGEQKLIVADGKYLMPGLAEMHAHIPPSSRGKRVEEVLILYLSQGITTIRGMLGESSHLRLRQAVKQGQIIGPRIYTAGPSLNGNSVNSPEQAIELVQQQHADGYDHIKLHPGLSLEEFNAIIKTAKKLDFPIGGHVSLAVGAKHAIQSKQYSIDHMDDFLRAIIPERHQAASQLQLPGFFGIGIVGFADAAEIDALAQSIAKAGIWVIPTETLMDNLAGSVALKQLQQLPGMQYMPQETQDQWSNSWKNFQEQNQDQKIRQRFLSLRQQLIFSIGNHDNRLLLGADAPQIFNVPGFSIHREMALYIKAGLSPQQVLIAGSSNVARYFNLEETRGQVKTGYDADLVLLRANPLDDITHAQNIEGVMVAGQWHSREKLDKELKLIASRYN